MTELEPLDRVAEAIEALHPSSALAPKSDASLLARREIVRTVLQALREPSFQMIFAGLDHLKIATRSNIAGPALEKAWVAMVDVLLTDLLANDGAPARMKPAPLALQAALDHIGATVSSPVTRRGDAGRPGIEERQVDEVQSTVASATVPRARMELTG